MLAARLAIFLAVVLVMAAARADEPVKAYEPRRGDRNHR